MAYSRSERLLLVRGDNFGKLLQFVFSKQTASLVFSTYPSPCCVLGMVLYHNANFFGKDSVLIYRAVPGPSPWPILKMYSGLFSHSPLTPRVFDTRSWLPNTSQSFRNTQVRQAGSMQDHSNTKKHFARSRVIAFVSHFLDASSFMLNEPHLSLSMSPSSVAGPL